MKQRKILLSVLVGFITFTMVSSCNKDEGKNSNQSSIAASSNSVQPTYNFTNSQLLIVPIPFSNNMFHFPSEASYQAVKDEISVKMDEYQEYFIWRNLNFSSFDKITKVTGQVTEEMTDTQVSQLLAQHQVTPNENNEIDYKFNMMYKNLLLNCDGLVSVGSFIVGYSAGLKSYYNSLDHYKLCISGRSTPVKVVDLDNSYVSNELRGQKCNRECRSDFDNSFWSCQDRRLRGKLAIELEGAVGAPTCSVLYKMEASTKWFRRKALIWWLHKAKELKVSANWGVFNGRGDGGFNTTCIDNTPPTENKKSNTSSVFLTKALPCDNFIADGKTSCIDDRDKNFNGIFRGQSSHSGEEDGNCGGTASCTIMDCL